MQIVIEIGEEYYEWVQSLDWENGALGYDKCWIAIHNGTPLPENHGRIVDLDTVTVEEDSDKGVLWLDAPTILEAYYRK